MTAASQPGDLRAFALQARLAAVLAHPVEAVDGVHLAPLSPAETRALAGNAAFRAPVNRAAAALHGLDRLPLTAEGLARLGTSARARLAVLLATVPLPELTEAARLLAGAVLHRRVLRLALKADRERARAILGEAGMQVATQEAPLLHPALAELDDGTLPPGFLADTADLDAQRGRLDGFGLGLLARYATSVDGALAPLLALRLPAVRNLAPLADAHLDHIAKLIRRKVAPWQAIIG